MTTPPYILDTDSVTHQQAGQTAVLRRLSTVSPDTVFTIVVTVREQLRGRLVAVDQAPEGPKLLLAYDRLLATMRPSQSQRGRSFAMTADKQLNDQTVALPQRPTPKPLAKNYLADLIGVNLRHALETYQWDDLRPWTVDGVTVAGFRVRTSTAKPND